MPRKEDSYNPATIREILRPDSFMGLFPTACSYIGLELKAGCASKERENPLNPGVTIDERSRCCSAGAREVPSALGALSTA